MCKEQQKTNPKDWLNAELANAARRGDVKEAKKLIYQGANLKYQVPLSRQTIMELAASNGHIDFIDFLINDCGMSDPKTIGITLLYASTPEMVKYLAQYHPDCTVTKSPGFTAYEMMIWYKKCDLLAAYKESGLPIIPLSKEIFNDINARSDLKAWSLATGIEVPDDYYRQLKEPLFYERINSVYSRIINELSKGLLILSVR